MTPADPGFSASRRALAIISRRRSTGLSVSSVAGYLVLLLASAAGGFLMAPTSLAPFVDGDITRHGGWCLESAFTAACLIAAISAFRAMETLYRDDDAAMQLHPFHGGALALDRLTQVARDTGLVFSLPVAAFAPLIIRGDGAFAMAGIAWLAVAFGVVVACSFAGNVLIADQAGGADSAVTRAAGATSGGVFHIAPGITLAVSAALLLFAKLGFEELLRTRYESGAFELTRAAQVALGGSIVVAVLLCIAAFRRYSARYASLQCAFRMADFVGTSQVDGFDDELKREPAGSPGTLFGAALAIQLRRKHPFLRGASVSVALLLVFVGWATRGSISALLPALAASAWLALYVAPALRVWRLLTPESEYLAGTLIRETIRLQAKKRAALNELIFHAAALAPVALLSPGVRLQALGLIAAGALSASVAIQLWRGSRVGPTLVWLAASAIAGAAALFGDTGIAACTVSLAVLGIAVAAPALRKPLPAVPS